MIPESVQIYDNCAAGINATPMAIWRVLRRVGQVFASLFRGVVQVYEAPFAARPPLLLAVMVSLLVETIHAVWAVGVRIPYTLLLATILFVSLLIIIWPGALYHTYKDRT